MTAASDRHRAAEIARLRKVLDDPAAHPFESESAQKALTRLTAPPTCQWCLRPETEHNGAVCRVLHRFRLKHGKALFPTATQAEELRKAIAASEKADEVAARRKDLRGRQGSLF